MIRTLALAAWRSLGLALAGGVVLGTALAYGDRPGEPVGDVQDVLFLGGGPPVLIRFHVQINEMPLSAAWREAVVKLHAYLDTNGDGTLRREEAERVEWPRLVRLFGNAVRAPAAMTKGAAAPAPLPALDFRPQDGVVSVEELGEFLRALRTPFSVQTRPPSESDQDTTFVRIDTNGDGTISAEERAQAASLLRRFDQNDDETLSAGELAEFRNPIFGMAMQQQQNAPEPPVVLLDPGASRIRMVHQLLNRLDTGGVEGSKTKDHRLSRAEIGLGSDAFKEFDNDGDETLDSDELMQFLDRGEPAVELIVRLGPRPLNRNVVEFIDRQLTSRGKPGLGPALKPHNLEVVERPGQGVKDPPRVRVRRGDDTVVTLDLGDVLVDLHTEESPEGGNSARQIFESIFQNVDADKNNSISLAEVKNQEPLQSLFRLMDRNGDGQVHKDEMTAALALLDEVSRRQALLGVADRGVLLFGNLDTNGDGRLGLRELRRASERLATFDRDGDGRITSAEIPHRFDWFLSQAPLPLGFPVRAVLRRGMPEATARTAAGGPVWFQKMDRNRDGDLSPREFLGPRAEFQRLDANADGLIEAAEVK